MVELNFEMLEGEATLEYAPLPKGWYSASVMETERTTSSAGNDYLNVTFEVTQADHAGRRVWNNFNLWHPTENVRGIGERQFSDLARACGLASCKDTDELLDLHLDISLTIEEGSGTYGPKNRVVAYRSAPSAQPPVMAKAANGDTSSLDDPPW